jgi:hypothetical protein
MLGTRKKEERTGRQWLMPVILATQKAEIRPGKIVCETLSSKTHHKKKKKRAGGVVQGVGPQFKPTTTTKKKSK